MSDNTYRFAKALRGMGRALMQVTVLDKIIDYANEAEAVDQLLKDVNELLAEQQLIIKYITMDGQEVHDDYAEELLDRLGHIQDVRIVDQTREQASQQICLTAANYLERALPQIQLLFTELYQGPTSDSWDRMTQLIDGLQWLYETSNLLVLEWQQPSLKHFFDSFIQKMDMVVPDLVSSMETRDAISIADIVKYELFPALEEMQRGVQQIIDNKVVKSDVN
jgi:hypothetical protein